MVDVENVVRVITLDAQIKELKKEFDRCKTYMKAQMQTEGLKSYDYGDSRITLSYTERNTPAKDAVLNLITMGLQSCIKTEPEVDVDRLKMEVGRTISQADYEKFVKTSQVCTLSVKEVK